MYGFLREFVGRKVPVIPVLLPDAPMKPELPIFLRAMTWVDFHADDPDPFAQLLGALPASARTIDLHRTCCRQRLLYDGRQGMNLTDTGGPAIQEILV